MCVREKERDREKEREREREREKKWAGSDRVHVEKSKNGKKYMFGDSYIVPTRFDFKVLSEC